MVICMQKKSKKGLTLVELIVTMALLGIVMTSIGAFALTAMRAYVGNRGIQDGQQGARFALLAISRDVHLRDLRTNEYGELLREVTAVDGVLTIPVYLNGEFNITYFMQGGTLVRQGVPSGSWPVQFGAMPITSFVVSIANNAVDVEVVPLGSASLPFTTSIALQRLVDPEEPEY